MLFLIEYDRSKGVIVSLRSYMDSQRETAQHDRLELELVRHRDGIQHEIVILEAENEAAIRRTHGRYFKTLEELAQLPKD